MTQPIPQLLFTNRQYKLELSVENYQFPDGDNDWDQNWLNVNIVLYSGLTEWKKIDPCLTTLELIDLKNWFEQFDGLMLGSNYLRFIEPCFSFEKVGDFLRIHLANEFEPRNMSSALDTTIDPMNSSTEPFYIDFEWNELLKISVHHALEQMANLFPIRGDDANIGSTDFAEVLVV